EPDALVRKNTPDARFELATNGLTDLIKRFPLLPWITLNHLRWLKSMGEMRLCQGNLGNLG
ncbi:MAG: hypothetical protein WCG10_07895, partial [Chlamydiota bacterium]